MSTSAYHRIDDEEQGLQQTQTAVGARPTQYGLHFRPATPEAQCEVLLNRPHGLEVDPKSLIRYVEAALCHAPAPQFVLAIDFFVEDNPSSQARPSRSIEVSLPKPGLDRVPYCRPDDAPCFRGSIYASGGDAWHNCENFSHHWSLGGHRSPSVMGPSPPYHLSRSNDRIRPAATSTCLQWDTRMARRLCPPWKPLSEPGNVEDEHTSDARPWPSRDNRNLALEALQRFLRDKERANKYLVCPASCYGWDMRRLEAEIKRDFDLQGSGESGNTDGWGNLSTTTSSALDHLRSTCKSARVYIRPCRPALAIRMHANLQLESLSRLTRARIIFIYVALWFVHLGISLYAFEHYGAFPATVVTVTLAALLIWSYRSFSGYLLIASVHDPIGVAWALKRWTRLDDSIKTREQALETVSDVLDVRQHRNGSWSVLHGIDETAWWQQNKQSIFSAVQAEHQGVLFINERLPVFRSEASSSLSRSTGPPPPAYGDGSNNDSSVRF